MAPRSGSRSCAPAARSTQRRQSGNHAQAGWAEAAVASGFDIRPLEREALSSEQEGRAADAFTPARASRRDRSQRPGFAQCPRPGAAAARTARRRRRTICGALKLKPSLPFAHSSHAMALLRSRHHGRRGQLPRALAMTPISARPWGVWLISQPAGGPIQRRGWAEQALALVPGFPDAVMSSLRRSCASARRPRLRRGSGPC